MAKRSQKKSKDCAPLEGDALVKETCRRLRAAKSLWDAHRNSACRNEREKAIALYNQLTKAQKEQVPQQLRIWFRYRSEKYFGSHQTAPGSNHRSSKRRQANAEDTSTPSDGAQSAHANSAGSHSPGTKATKATKARSSRRKSAKKSGKASAQPSNPALSNKELWQWAQNASENTSKSR